MINAFCTFWVPYVSGTFCFSELQVNIEVHFCIYLEVYFQIIRKCTSVFSMSALLGLIFNVTYLDFFLLCIACLA